MTPLQLTHFTATSCLGSGLAATRGAPEEAPRGLAPCRFETVELDTYIGEVACVRRRGLPLPLERFDCRNNRLAQLGLMQDGFDDAVRAAIERYGPRRVGVYLGTSTSGILTTEIAYRHLDPVSARCRKGSTTPAPIIRFQWSTMSAGCSNCRVPLSRCAPPVPRAPRCSPPPSA